MPLAEIPSCFLTGRVLGPAGDPVDDVSVGARWYGADGRVCDVDSDTSLDGGRFRIGPVAPGRYRVQAFGKDYGTLPLGSTDVAAGAARDLGTHELARPSSLRLSVRLHDGTPAEGRLRIGRIGADSCWHAELRAGRCEVAPLQPGRYRIVPFGDSLPLHAVEVTVAADRAVEHKINWPRGVWRRLRHPPNPEGTFVEQIWRNPAGRLVFADVTSFAGSERSYELERLIPPGSYTVETRRGVHRATTVFVIDDVPESDSVLVVPMPTSR